MDSSFKLFWKAELGPAFTKKYVQCFFCFFRGTIEDSQVVVPSVLGPSSPHF